MLYLNVCDLSTPSHPFLKPWLYSTKTIVIYLRVEKVRHCEHAGSSTITVRFHYVHILLSSRGHHIFGTPIGTSSRIVHAPCFAKDGVVCGGIVHSSLAAADNISVFCGMACVWYWMCIRFSPICTCAMPHAACTWPLSNLSGCKVNWVCVDTRVKSR